MAETRSTCCYCGVGCGVVIESGGPRVTGVRGDPDHPANFGRLCSKGSTLHLSMTEGARLLNPELRVTRGEPRRRIGWEEALDTAAARFADCISTHGPDSVAFYISGQLLTEDYYVFNKLAKGLIGTNNVDTNSRLCMSSAVAGYKLSLGADAPPCCYEDIDHADLIFIAGSNTAFAHPVVYRRIEDARAARPGMKTIVVDPRRTETAREADLHIALAPGTDVMFFNAMLHVLDREGRLARDYIAAYTEGYESLAGLIAECTPARASAVCAVSAEDIVRAARWFGDAGAALSLYCQGLNQSASGTYKNSALINLHLATGQIGRPGAGPFSLTGQPNAMGGREVGGMANLMSAHRDLGNSAHREEIARLWGVPSVPAAPGKTAVELFQAVDRGEVRMVWIACTNPAQSMPDANLIARALERAEFVVVQEAFAAAQTCDYADLLLPAASWAEKEGTVTNSERRVSRVRRAVAPPGMARPDWEIAVDFARRLGSRLGRRGTRELFPYERPEQVFEEHRATTAGRDLDITGMSYELLEQAPQQWPMPSGATAGRQRLYSDGRYPTPSGRARFVVTDYVPPVELPDAAFPLCLTTGRLRDQWHSMTRTGLVARLHGHSPEPEIEMHPAELADHGIKTGDLVRVTSRRGSMVVKARSSADMRRGDAFMAMHWGARHVSGAGTNVLTLSAFDPHSRQPELKHAAVRVERVEPVWHTVMLRAVATPADAVSLHKSLVPLVRRFDYGAIALHEGERPVLSVEVASTGPVPAALVDELDQLLGLAPPERVLHYLDARRGVEKRALVTGANLDALRLSGSLAGMERLRKTMLVRDGVGAIRSQLLAPVSQLAGLPAQGGRTVCSCLGVGEQEIRRAAGAGLTLAAVQGTLKCGTQCGSCLPEVKRIIAEAATQPGSRRAHRAAG